MNSLESVETETHSEDAVLQTMDLVRAKSLIVQENTNFHEDSTFQKVPEHYCNKVIPLKYRQNKINDSSDYRADNQTFVGRLDSKVARLLGECYLSKRRFENLQDHKQRKEIINNHYDEMQQRLKQISQRFSAQMESEGEAHVCLFEDDRESE